MNNSIKKESNLALTYTGIYANPATPTFVVIGYSFGFLSLYSFFSLQIYGIARIIALDQVQARGSPVR